MSLIQLSKKKRPESEQTKSLVATLEEGRAQEQRQALKEKLAKVDEPQEAAPSIREKRVKKAKTAKAVETQDDIERVTVRFPRDLVAKLDAIALLEIEYRNTVMETALTAWVEGKWKELQTTKGSGDVEFAYRRATAALEKKSQK